MRALSNLGCSLIKGHWKNFHSPHCFSKAMAIGSYLTKMSMSSCSLSLSSRHTSCSTIKWRKLALSFLFFPSLLRCTWDLLATVMYVRRNIVFFMSTYMGCPWKVHVHASPLVLGESTPSKTKINAQMKYGNARGMILYLLGPSRRSFHPLKLSESTFLTKEFFLLLVNFQIAMVKMSCQLLFIDFFYPFCHFLTHFVIFPGLVITCFQF